jgi:hypothetical protein
VDTTVLTDQSSFSKFHQKLRFIDVIENGIPVPKYILWARFKNTPLSLRMIENQRHPSFKFVKRLFREKI